MWRRELHQSSGSECQKLRSQHDVYRTAYLLLKTCNFPLGDRSNSRYYNFQYKNPVIVFDTLIRTMSSLSISDLSTDQLKSALDHLVTCPAATNLQLQHLLSVPPRVAWSVSNILVSSIRTFLDPRVPRHTQVQQRMSVEKVTFVKLLLTYKSS